MSDEICTCFDGHDPHPCAFKVEIPDNTTHPEVCNCCPACTDSCKDDV